MIYKLVENILDTARILMYVCLIKSLSGVKLRVSVHSEIKAKQKFRWEQGTLDQEQSVNPNKK